MFYCEHPPGDSGRAQLTSVSWAHCAHPAPGRLQVRWIYVVWLSATQHEAGGRSCKYAICPAKCRSTKSREFLLKTVSIWWAHHATADSSIREPVKLDWQTVVASDCSLAARLGCPHCPHDAFLRARASLLTEGGIRSLDSAWNAVTSFGHAEIIHCHLSHCGGVHCCNQEHSCGNPDI